jgi:hypothetical protein
MSAEYAPTCSLANQILLERATKCRSIFARLLVALALKKGHPVRRKPFDKAA